MAAKYSSLRIQTTSSALPVPIVYGRNILAPNVVWYQNFQAHPQKSGGKGGGKGGGAGSKGTSYTYSADIIMGVCEGPVNSIAAVWQGSPTPTSLAALALSFFNGASPQATWSYLAAKYPSQALAYGGTCTSPQRLSISAWQAPSMTTISKSSAFTPIPAAIASTLTRRWSSTIS